MPWGIADVDRHIKDLTDKQKRAWVAIANSARDRCLKDGGTVKVCDASAIRQANKVAGGLKKSMETTSLREKIRAALDETEISENATFKAQVQALLRSADGVAKNKSVPDKVKSSIQNLRTLLHQTWGDIDVGTDVGTVDAGEAILGGAGGMEEAATQMVDGVPFPASDFAYVPDPEKSSTWKLRLTAKPGGPPDAGIVGAAIAAIGKGFRGNKVQIPAADMPAVKAKIRAAWKKANPDKSAADMPSTIAESIDVIDMNGTLEVLLNEGGGALLANSQQLVENGSMVGQN